MDAFQNHLEQHLRLLCATYPDRHLGGPGNRAATDLFARVAAQSGFEVASAELDCIEWEAGPSELVTADGTLALHTGPYSLPVEVTARLAVASSVEEIKAGDFTGAVLLLVGDVVAEQLMPKNFPFYNPDHHQRIVRALEAQAPAAIIAATAKNPELAGGVYPFPLVEDGDFDIPNAYITDVEGEVLRPREGEIVSLRIASGRVAATATQLVARKCGTGVGRVVLMAHIDSKDGTPGALDNASGVAALLGAMELLAEVETALTVEVVPLNGEDYYAAVGQRYYLLQNADRLGDIVVAINADGAGFAGAAVAASFYSTPPQVEGVVRAAAARHGIADGPQWYQGDHSMLVMNGVPAVALTSENAFFITSTVAHTPRDTIDVVDPAAVADVSRFFADVAAGLADAEVPPMTETVQPLSSAEVALLGLLSEKAKHAWQIEKDVEFRDMRSWTDLSKSTIYKQLRSLEGRGMVDASNEIVDGRLRSVYALTKAGRTALEARLLDLLGEPEPLKCRIDLATYNLGCVPAEQAVAALAGYRTKLAEQIRGWGDLEEYLRSSGCPPYRFAIARRRIRMLEGEIVWIDEFLGEITRPNTEGGR